MIYLFNSPNWQQLLDYVLGVLDHWGLVGYISAFVVFSLVLSALSMMRNSQR